MWAHMSLPKSGFRHTDALQWFSITKRARASFVFLPSVWPKFSIYFRKNQIVLKFLTLYFFVLLVSAKSLNIFEEPSWENWDLRLLLRQIRFFGYWSWNWWVLPVELPVGMFRSVLPVSVVVCQRLSELPVLTLLASGNYLVLRLCSLGSLFKSSISNLKFFR